MSEPQDLEVSIDGERVKVFTLQGAAAPAGPPASEPAATGVPTPRNQPDERKVAAPGARAGGAGRGGGRAGAGGNAQSRRPRLGGAGAGEGRTARRAGGVREGDQCGRRDRAAAIPPAVSSRRQHRRDAYPVPICEAWRSRDRSIRPVPATRRTGSASLICTPGSPANEDPCAVRIHGARAARFRRPVSGDRHVAAARVLS